jgi:hypothetical protein
MDTLVVFCADAGSVESGNFGWARRESNDGAVADLDGARPADLAEAGAAELRLCRPVALGLNARSSSQF